LQDLRERLGRAVEEGASARTAAARFAVSASAAIKLVRRVRQAGRTAPAKIGGYRKPLLVLLVLDGPVTGEAFLARVGQFLAPVPAEGDVVVLDNLPAHAVAGVREAIRAMGARLLYLPPYSPDLNPVEQVFARLKALLRNAAARTRKALWTTLGGLLDTFTPAKCRNYLANSGYAFQQIGKALNIPLGRREGGNVHMRTGPNPDRHRCNACCGFCIPKAFLFNLAHHLAVARHWGEDVQALGP